MDLRISKRIKLKKIFPFNKSLTFNNINFYHNQLHILKNININFEYGSTVAPVGSSGAGKSTILDLFAGLSKPNQGDFLIDGVPFTSLKSIWGNSIRYIPQNIYFKNDSIKNNKALCLDESIIEMERVLDALKLAQLSSFCSELPEGLDTTLG